MKNKHAQEVKTLREKGKQLAAAVAAAAEADPAPTTPLNEGLGDKSQPSAKTLRKAENFFLNEKK